MAGGRWGGDVDSSTAMLKSINAPIMHPLILSRYTEKQWNESRHGLGQSEAMVMLMDSLRKDCWVVPISIVAAGGESLEALRTLLSEAAPKLIISMQGFRIGGGPMGG